MSQKMGRMETTFFVTVGLITLVVAITLEPFIWLSRKFYRSISPRNEVPTGPAHS